MKKHAIRISILLLGVFVIPFIMSCSQPSQNANVPTNQNTNANLIGDTCEGSLEEKLQKLQAKLDKRFKDDKDIKKQLGQGFFKFKIDKASGTSGQYIVLYLEGTIVGNDHFPDLLKIVKDYMKKGCLEKVTFVPPGSIVTGGTGATPSPTVAPSPMGTPGPVRLNGFEWLACDSPMVPCPDGSCSYPDSCSGEWSVQ